MNESVSSRRMVRFGVYELDLASGELRKGGLKIRLSGQPFQILAMLLERPGEVVTREQLQQKLLPGGTFVDFDHSLNTAINKIREALGDSAENGGIFESSAE
jgi:cholera toxin transcriptional activator